MIAVEAASMNFFRVLLCISLLKKKGIHLNLWVETNENDTGSSAPRPPRDFLKALASPRHYAWLKHRLQRQKRPKKHPKKFRVEFSWEKKDCKSLKIKMMKSRFTIFYPQILEKRQKFWSSVSNWGWALNLPLPNPHNRNRLRQIWKRAINNLWY